MGPAAHLHRYHIGRLCLTGRLANPLDECRERVNARPIADCAGHHLLALTLDARLGVCPLFIGLSCEDGGHRCRQIA